MVRDRVRVAAFGVPPSGQPPAAGADLLRRRSEPREQGARAAQLPEQPEPRGQVDVHGLGIGHPGQRRVHVPVHVEVAGHVRPGEPERPRRLGQVGHGDGRPDRDADGGSIRARAAPVVRNELDRGVGSHESLENLRQGHSCLAFLDLTVGPGQGE